MIVNNSNVAYNYQKTPNLNTTNARQSAIATVIGLRNINNDTRGVYFRFPINQSTPYMSAGSPTLAAISAPSSIGEYPYAGVQINV